MTHVAIKACALLLAVLGLWGGSVSRDAIAWPNRDSYSPVAKVQREYSDPSKVRQGVRAIQDVAAENNFFLSGGLNNPHLMDGRGFIELSYLRGVDGVEMILTTIHKAKVLEVYFYDRLRKGTWQEMKDKVEAAINRSP